MNSCREHVIEILDLITMALLRYRDVNFGGFGGFRVDSSLVRSSRLSKYVIVAPLHGLLAPTLGLQGGRSGVQGFFVCETRATLEDGVGVSTTGRENHCASGNG